MTPERIAMLEEIGMIWVQPDYIFERNYAALVEYHKKYGDVNVSADYVTEDGVRLGSWVSSLKTKNVKGV